jgi:putative transposase
MLRAFKYRLYPTKSQKRVLDETLELCRHLYNGAIEERKDAWKKSRISISFNNQSGQLPDIKAIRSEYCDVYAQVSQDVLHRVDKAFKAFFRRVKTGEKPGYPRFKGCGWYDSFTYPQQGFSIGADSVTLSKIGTIKATIHRPIVGQVKTCCIKRSHTGKWFAAFSCEIADALLPDSFERIGIDVGLSSFATLSNGNYIPNPKFLRIDEEILARAQRKMSKTAKGSKERAKKKLIVSRIHEHIADRRQNFAHQWSRKIVDQYGVIAVEDLAIKNMVHNHHLAKSISDAAWRQFTSCLSYKAESAGRKFVAVNPAYTSQDCSRCGYRQPMPLSERIFNCPSCGLSLNRDHNAALNILAIGLDSLGLSSLEAPDFRLGEQPLQTSPLIFLPF